MMCSLFFNRVRCNELLKKTHFVWEVLGVGAGGWGAPPPFFGERFRFRFYHAVNELHLFLYCVKII